MLEFNTAFEKDILVIELEGSLDSHSAADFRAWFNEKTRAGYRAFAIDCLCLEYISSAGIGALIDLQNALQGQQGKMVLFQLSSETRQLLKFLQLEKKLHLAGDYDDAIQALTGIKKIVKEEVPPLVEAGEIRVLPKAEESEAAPAGVMAPPPADVHNEMHMEEHFSAEKKGLHPLHEEITPAPRPAPAAAPEAPAAVAPAAEAPAPPKSAPVAEAPLPPPPPPVVEEKPSPEAQEIKINAAAKRLITCPNCKSVLRLAVAGEYLCPACRFRFTYKGTAERPPA